LFHLKFVTIRLASKTLKIRLYAAALFETIFKCEKRHFLQ